VIDKSGHVLGLVIGEASYADLAKLLQKAVG
jgi:hypothetical protein